MRFAHNVHTDYNPEPRLAAYLSFSLRVDPVCIFVCARALQFTLVIRLQCVLNSSDPQHRVARSLSHSSKKAPHRQNRILLPMYINILFDERIHMYSYNGIWESRSLRMILNGPARVNRNAHNSSLSSPNRQNNVTKIVRYRE